MSIDKIVEFAGVAPESDKNTNELDLSRGFPSRLHPARQWFNYLFNTVTKKINEIIDGKLDIDANAVSASKLQTQRTVSFSGAATGSFNFDGSQDSSAILTLANSGVEASTYGGAFKIPVVTVNAKGLITGVSTQDIQNASGSQKGVVQIGTGLSVASGVVSSTAVGSSGQSYQDVTASRASGTTYTNSTGRTITVLLSVQDSAGGAGDVVATVGSIVVCNLVNISQGSSAVMFLVPDGQTYSIRVDNSISKWVELR